MRTEELERTAEINLLYDFYGELLPEKQQQLFRLHHQDDLSLSEIGEELGITRQGVHDFLRRAENRLRACEKTLGLAEKFRRTEQQRQEAAKALDALIKKHSRDPALQEELLRIKGVIEGLE